MPYSIMQAIDEFSAATEVVRRVPERAAHFDAFAEDRKVADDNAHVTKGAEYQRVARIPEPVWSVLMKLSDSGMCPNPLKDDKFFYGWLLKHPEWQAYTMKRRA